MSASVRRALRRAHARWRLHRLEWNAQYRALDEYDERAGKRPQRSEARDEHEREREREHERAAGQRSQPLRHAHPGTLWRRARTALSARVEHMGRLATAYAATWDYAGRRRREANDPLAAADDEEAEEGEEAAAAKKKEEEEEESERRRLHASLDETARRARAIGSAIRDTATQPHPQQQQQQQLSALLHERVAAFRHSLRAFAEGYAQGQREGGLFTEASDRHNKHDGDDAQEADDEEGDEKDEHAGTDERRQQQRR